VRSRPALALVGLVAAAVLVAGACTDKGKGSSEAAVKPGSAITSTTINTGGIHVDAPERWRTIPVPDLGFGLAVPPGWEATLLSPQGLATLAGASPKVPEFTDLAHAAAQSGGLLYAAGVDDQGGVSDVVVRGAPNTGVKDVAGLTAYAKQIAAQAGRPNQAVTPVDGAEHPTVQMRFQVPGVTKGAKPSQATETLVAGPNNVVWDITITSDTASIHDALARQINDTFTLAPKKKSSG
jgi:hypothetical protein